MRAKITKETIDDLREKAQAEGKTLYLFDSEMTGFGAVATKKGACSYWIEYRLGGRGSPSRRVTIGKHGALAPTEARRKAKQELGKVANGVDVAQAKRESRERPTGQTLQGLIERYLAKHEKPTRYWKEKRARLLSNDLKALHGRPVTLIKRGEIAAAIDKVEERSQAAARLLFADIRPIFAWALDRAMIETNPMAAMKGPALSDARDRVLSDEEVKAFWQAASDLGWPFENIFKLLLLTGQRRDEVAGMRWAELDLGAGVWTIAKERCKNGKAHVVDLHPEAIQLINPDLELVFSTTGRTQVSGFSRAKERLDIRIQAILGDKFQPWRTHDLRRTAASGMAALGFPPHIIERVLNHVSGAQGGLVSVYQRHEYRRERKEAIIAWGDHVLRLVSYPLDASREVER